jgi:acid phosphatase family membrane protein YuiD
MTSNSIINIVLLSWLVAQALKVLIILIETRKIDFSRFIGAGGMPSAHAATVVSLTTAIARTNGIDSPMFAVAFTVALVVMYDAAGVRLAAGKQARVLNKIIENWDKNKPDLFGEELKELIGHTPFQVIVGALLGFLIAMVVPVTH